jgi:hypothetical protein
MQEWLHGMQQARNQKVRSEIYIHQKDVTKGALKTAKHPTGYMGRDQEKDKVKTEEVKPEEDILDPVRLKINLKVKKRKKSK